MPTLRELVDVGRSQGLNQQQIMDSISVRYGKGALYEHPDKPLPDISTAVPVQGSREGPKPQPATFTGPNANISGPVDYYSMPATLKAIGDLGLSRPPAIVGGDITIPFQAPAQEAEAGRRAIEEARKPQEPASAELSKTKGALKQLMGVVPEWLTTQAGHLAGLSGFAFDPNLSMTLAAPGDEFHAIPSAESIKGSAKAKIAGANVKNLISKSKQEVEKGNREATEQGLLANVHPSAQRAATGMREFLYGFGGLQPTGAEEKPFGERILTAFQSGVERGEQALTGGLGGTAAMLQHPYEAAVGDPITTGLTAVPLFKGAKAGVGAGLRAAETAGGTLGKAASSLLKVGEAVNPLAQAGRGAQFLESLSNLYPEQSTVSSLIEAAQKDGMLTAEQAAAIARQAQPNIPYRVGGQIGHALNTFGPVIGSTIGSGLTGAGLGAMIGGPAGAALGAGLGAVGPLARAAFLEHAPEGAAWVARMLKDPNIQSTEQGTVLARDVGTEPNTIGRAVANLQREAGGFVGAGDVALKEGGEKITRLPITQKVRALTPEGTLQKLPENVQRGIDTSGLRAEERGQQFVMQQIAQRAPEHAEAVQPVIDAAKAEQEALGRTPAEREFTAGHEYPLKPKKIVAETTNPQVERIVQEMHGLQTKLGGDLPLDETRRMVAEPLQNDSITLLRERGFRGKVAKDLTRQIGGNVEAESRINQWLYDMTEHALSGDAISYELHLPDGNVVTIPQAIEMAVNDLSSRPEGQQIMNRVRSGAMDQIAQHIQRQVEDAHRARALDVEQRRFAMDKIGPNEPNKVIPGLIRRLMRGEAEPQLLQDANVIAEELRANPDAFADAVEASDPNNPVRPSREFILDLADKLEKNYAPVSQDIKQFMASNGTPAMPRLYGHKGYQHTANLAINYSRAIHNMSGFARAVSMAKRNLVARNLKATINNASQNLMLTSFVDGADPMTSMAKVADSGLKVRDYYSGAPMSEAERAKWRAGARAGAFDANQFETEARAFGKGKPSQGAFQATARGAGKLMDYGYQLGDQVFKAHRFSETYDQVMSDFANLKRKVTYEQNGVKITVERQGDKYAVSQPGKATKVVSLDSDVLRDIAAKNGAEVANGLFFNMQEKPGLVMWASSVGGGAGSMINPFIHWPLLALDLPGKKGLVSRVLAYDGTAPMFTNDPGLLAKQAQRAMRVGAQRLVMGQAMNALLDDRSGDLQQVLGRTPRDVSTAILRNVLDPTLNARVSPGGNEWFAMTDTAFRLGLAGVAMFTDPEEFEKPAKTQLERTRRDLFKKLTTGELAEPADLLKFANVNGGMWYDAFKELEKSDYSNNPTAWHKIAMQSLRMAIGGTAADIAVDLPVGLIAGPGSKWTTRQMGGTETAHPKAQDWFDFTMRSVAGLGSKIVNMDERGLKKYEKALAEMETIVLKPAIEDEQTQDSLARAAKDRGDFVAMREYLALKQQARERANKMRFVMKEIERTESEKLRKVRALIKAKVPNAQFQDFNTDETEQTPE